jgi:glycosyltransferase involved in cell wall biosynthesis
MHQAIHRLKQCDLVIIADRYTRLSAILEGKEANAGSPAPWKCVELLPQYFGRALVLYPSETPGSRIVVYGGMAVDVVPIYRHRVASVIDAVKWVKALVKQRELDPDRLVFYGMGYYGLVANVLGALWRRPAFVRLFGTFLAPLVVDRKLSKADIRNLPKLATQALVFRTVRSGVVITDDGTRGAEVSQKLGVGADKQLIIRNGLETKRIREARERARRDQVLPTYGVGSNEFTLLWASRLTGWKRVDLGIRMFARVVIEHRLRDTSGSIRFLVAGRGEEDVVQELRQLASGLGVGDSVVFCGDIPQDELWRLMACADLFVSLYEVGNIGNAVLESLLLGLPVIARACGDTGGIIKNGVTGVLVSGNEEEVVARGAAAALELVESPSKLAALKRTTVRYAQEEITSWAVRMEREAEFIAERTEYLTHGQRISLPS